MSTNSQILSTVTQGQERLETSVMQGNFVQPMGRTQRSVSANIETDNNEVHEMLSKAGITVDQALKSTPWNRRRKAAVVC